MKFIVRVLIIALALLLAAYIIPGITVVMGVPLLVAAVALGILNAVVRPILVVLTLPLSIVTLGLFLLVINGFLFWFVAQYVDGFQVSGFWSALFGALIVSVVSSVANKKA
jgi:putative membrane protein